ncbi:hypothetical protein GOP47_0018005 [Adiantum capillus-veneris]|uniref:Uncharacterized protein n=1 Tax=Adiantum capillus-veneris TaxID=13818 RepID=A0A9D4ZB43_ADICA|nr:hypothetical protein GOP47_0018005 [Adiantum capillus-veneris]
MIAVSLHPLMTPGPQHAEPAQAQLLSSPAPPRTVRTLLPGHLGHRNPRTLCDGGGLYVCARRFLQWQPLLKGHARDSQESPQRRAANREVKVEREEMGGDGMILIMTATCLPEAFLQEATFVPMEFATS